MPTYVTLDADKFIDATVRLLTQALPSSSGAAHELDYYTERRTFTLTEIQAMHERIWEQRG